MARRGFLARFTDAVKGFFRPPAESPGPPPPPPTPPPGGGGGGGGFFPPGDGSGGDGLTPENRIWRNRAIGPDEDNYVLQSDYRDLYENATAPLHLDAEEDARFWDEFLRAFYLTLNEKGSMPRDRFYRSIGIRKKDFEMDWQEWREIKRGTP